MVAASQRIAASISTGRSDGFERRRRDDLLTDRSLRLGVGRYGLRVDRDLVEDDFLYDLDVIAFDLPECRRGLSDELWEMIRCRTETWDVIRHRPPHKAISWVWSARLKMDL